MGGSTADTVLSRSVGSHQAHALASIERLVTWWESDAVVDHTSSQLRVFVSSLSISPITFTFTFARSASCMDASLTSPITVTLNALGLIGGLLPGVAHLAWVCLLHVLPACAACADRAS